MDDSFDSDSVDSELEHDLYGAIYFEQTVSQCDISDVAVSKMEEEEELVANSSARPVPSNISQSAAIVETQIDEDSEAESVHSISSTISSSSASNEFNFSTPSMHSLRKYDRFSIPRHRDSPNDSKDHLKFCVVCHKRGHSRLECEKDGPNCPRRSGFHKKLGYVALAKHSIQVYDNKNIYADVTKSMKLAKIKKARNAQQTEPEMTPQIKTKKKKKKQKFVSPVLCHSTPKASTSSMREDAQYVSFANGCSSTRSRSARSIQCASANEEFFSAYSRSAEQVTSTFLSSLLEQSPQNKRKRHHPMDSNPDKGFIKTNRVVQSVRRL
ncbi:hypothetical protein Ciccas_008987 [Cichlidogyrus casuarinus]|uniref:Uncharacterized protein n=1 Tax=Cichlidogyrus casuarinus TaxID=1844966 RepID=A0ABD2PYB6_9PLAT